MRRVHIYIYIYIYTCVYTCIYTRIYMCMYIYIYRYTIITIIGAVLHEDQGEHRDGEGQQDLA